MQRSRFSYRFHLFILTVLMTAAGAAHAQIDILGRTAEQIGKKTDLSSLLEGEPPIATSLEHAIYGDESMDNINPERFRSLLELQRTPSGGFVLQPGDYEMQTQSYCLKA